MLEAIINKNLMFLQKYGVKMDSDEDKDIYKYGLQIVYSYIIDLIIIFSLASLFGKLYETSIMIFIFALLQAFGGGYHAKTKFGCLSLMVIGSIVGNILVDVIINYKIFMIASAIVLTIVILILIPIKNKNHPVSRKIYMRSKFISRFIMILCILVMLSLITINKNNEVAVIISTLYLYVISLIIVKVGVAPAFPTKEALRKKS